MKRKVIALIFGFALLGSVAAGTLIETDHGVDAARRGYCGPLAAVCETPTPVPTATP